jgi:hypothetical protein
VATPTATATATATPTTTPTTPHKIYLPLVMKNWAPAPPPYRVFLPIVLKGNPVNPYPPSRGSLQDRAGRGVR